jgi:predicted  nucleic acid-binding Zn-ribbon protein
MSIFDAYDDEFTSLAREVSSTMSHVNTYEESHEKKLKELKKANDILSHANELVKSMEIEVRSQEDAGTKRDMKEKVTEYKKTLSSLRRDYEELKQQEEHAALIEDPAAEQRSRLMSANIRLERGSERIKYALNVVVETENTALEITEELNGNREKIEGIHSRVCPCSPQLPNLTPTTS